MTTREYWSIYEPWATLHLAPATMANRKAAMRKLERILKSEVETSSCGSIRMITAEILNSIRLTAANPSTFNAWVRECSAMFQPAVTGELGQVYLESNPFKLVKRLRENKPEIRIISASDCARLVKLAKEHSAPRLDCLFALAAYCGLRKRELVECRWEWLDWDANILRVCADGRFKPKAHDAATVLFQECKDVLAQYRKDEGYIYYPHKQKGPGLYRVKFDTAWKTVCRRAGLAEVTPHDLRHTFVSLALKQAPMHDVCKLARHASIKTTIDVYGHLVVPDKLTLVS